MASAVMRQLERAVGSRYPEVTCYLREDYHDWNSRVGRDIEFWHEEIRNINSFLNWLIVDRYRMLSEEDRAQLKLSMLRARNCLGSVNEVNHVDGWISNLLDRYFPTYVRMVSQ